jgi:hypothetical protein
LGRQRENFRAVKISGMEECSAVEPTDGTTAAAGIIGLLTVFGGRYVIVALWIVALVNFGGLALRLPERVGREDFSSYYASAWLLRVGGNPYVSDLGPIGESFGLHIGALNHAAYTPTFMLCFRPLTSLNPRTAYWVWQALNAVALAAGLAMLLSMSGIVPKLALVLIPLLLLYPPLSDHFAYAQCQLMLLLIVVVSLRWLGRGYDAAAGLLMAFAALLRAFPLVIAGYFLFRRQWKVCAWLLAGLLLGAALTYAAVGPRCFDFVAGAKWANGFQFIALPLFVSVAAVASQLFWYTLGPHLSPGADAARLVLAGAAQLAILALTVRATLMMSGQPDRDWRLFSLWLATSVIISPNAQMHYLVLLFVPFVEFCAGSFSSTRALTAMVASYALSLVSCLGLSCVFALSSPQIQALARGPAWRVLGPGGWLLLLKEECAFAAMLIAYIAIYWWVVDGVAAPGGEPAARRAGASLGECVA